MNKEITYTESKGREAFNWKEFLNKKEYSKSELTRARELAGDWVTCAVGNQCNVIPRTTGGWPFDLKLERLGHRFAQRISTMSVNDHNTPFFFDTKQSAIKILEQIEKRSAQLIKKIENEND